MDHTEQRTQVESTALAILPSSSLLLPPSSLSGESGGGFDACPDFGWSIVRGRLLTRKVGHDMPRTIRSCLAAVPFWFSRLQSFVLPLPKSNSARHFVKRCFTNCDFSPGIKAKEKRRTVKRVHKGILFLSSNFSLLCSSLFRPQDKNCHNLLFPGSY